MENRAPGVQYFAYPGAPGDFFRCDRLSASMSTASCARRWEEANDRRRKHDPCDPLHRCKGCSLGSAHAGKVAAPVSPYYGARICARCHRPSSRLINKRLCPSCINRQYELLKGRNAKGKPPVNARPLFPFRVHYRGENGAVSDAYYDHAADSQEAMLSVLMLRRAQHISWRPQQAGAQATLW